MARAGDQDRVEVQSGLEGERHALAIQAYAVCLDRPSVRRPRLNLGSACGQRVTVTCRLQQRQSATAQHVGGMREFQLYTRPR